MKKRVVAKIFLWLFVLVALSHSTVHFLSYETELVGLPKESISGFSIGKVDIGDDILNMYPIKSSISRLVVIGEWFLIIVFALVIFLKGKLEFKREIGELQVLKKTYHEQNSTDLDKLYKILQKRSRVGFNTVSKAFNVDEEIVKNWAETLEEGNLAYIKYGKFGDAEIVLKKGEA
ncbi:MAG: hypothetical protein KJ718_04725 [Nanoarchaeota archaeon]|nr:hypothetical protein [Nanoarchaeota archaeon]MBU1051831.1 hypothetical protein [Nanoarchaeota archaeon]MBU1988438.1 hypothetical protein [Nanoarchaeota archaeon]